MRMRSDTCVSVSLTHVSVCLSVYLSCGRIRTAYQVLGFLVASGRLPALLRQCKDTSMVRIINEWVLRSASSARSQDENGVGLEANPQHPQPDSSNLIDFATYTRVLQVLFK